MARVAAVFLALTLAACGGGDDAGSGAGGAGGSGSAGGSGGGLADAGTSLACGADPLLSAVEMPAAEGAQHVPPGTQVDYAHDPPTSGPHYGAWAASAVYDRAVDPRSFVHNLEHGWLVLLYRPDASAAAVAALRDFWSAPPADPFCPGADVPRIIVSPAPDLPTAVAALTWTRSLTGESFDRETLTAFFRDCRAQAPEIRVCANGGEPAFLEGP